MQLTKFQSQYLWDPTVHIECYNQIVICKYAGGKINETRLGLKSSVNFLNINMLILKKKYFNPNVVSIYFTVWAG